MGSALLAGWVAGLSVAILVGTAAMVVTETASKRGMGIAAAGGAGIATGDALWAATAAAAGTVISRVLAPWERVLQWMAVGVLLVLLVRTVGQLVRGVATVGPVELPGSPVRAYGEFLGHALRDPVTAVFFSGLIIGAAPDYDAVGAAVFVLGVFLASLSWQWLLAVVGGCWRRGFSDRVRRGVLAVDCLLLGFFIMYVAFGLYRQ